MTSTGDYGQLASPRWVMPAIVVVAVVALVATGASFVWIMSEKEAHSSEASDFVEPDPAVLDGFQVPSSFRAMKDILECQTSQISRCYLTTLSESQAVGQADLALDFGHPERQVGRWGTSYVWCGTLSGAPVSAVVRQHVVNAKRSGPGSWNLPDVPQFDDQWAFGVYLLESPCD